MTAYPPRSARFYSADDLHVLQAALTGESMPAERAATAGEIAAAGPDAPALVYLGTSVVSGTATAVVFATGPRTAFGDIVKSRVMGKLYPATSGAAVRPGIAADEGSGSLVPAIATHRRRWRRS